MIEKTRDLIRRCNDGCRRFFVAKGQWAQVDSSLKSLDVRLEESRAGHQSSVEKGDILNASVVTMKALIDELSAEGFAKLKGLVTYGLQVIFEGRNYELDIEVSERGNMKTAEFMLCEVVDGVTYRTKLRDAVGGGVQSIVSLILRIFFSLYMEHRRFFVFDESLVHVSSVYIEGLFKFLRYVVDDLGYKILFVSHDPRFIPYADRVYEVKRGDCTLKSKE